jgi:tRNA (guanine37-N1)-methyltransferase
MISFDVVTIFPQMFDGILKESILKRAQDGEHLQVKVHDLRDWSPDKKHRKVDDPPYGGGAGMVMMVEPIVAAIRDLKQENSYVVLLSASGNTFNQAKALDYSYKEHIILICGHYEGVDARVIEYIDEEVCVGEFVMTGGEIPAMAIIDATTRLIHGVLGNEDSPLDESFQEEGVLEYPHYTRPEEFENLRVPDILLSGNHAQIKKWREEHRKKKAV